MQFINENMYLHGRVKISNIMAVVLFTSALVSDNLILVSLLV
jgi:hypothetical protein